MTDFVSASSLLDAVRGSTVVSKYPTAAGVTIGTHDGAFHCDEALAISMLKLLPDYASATVIRTRNPEVLAQCQVVVDVGAVYIPEQHRYDHHQREFTHTLEGWSTKLSSAGLVYKHFGHAAIRRVLSTVEGQQFTDEFVSICYDKVYKNFMEHIDANDNGVSVSDGPMKYHVSTTLPSRVGQLNPAWNQDNSTEVCNARFIDAMALTCSEFIDAITRLASVWWPARSIVQTALNGRTSIHPSGQIILMDTCCPWKDHIFELEAKEEPKQGKEQILYCIYGDTGGSWRVQAVPLDANSFDSRKKLPECWQGVRNQELSDKAGIEGCIFVHASGFIGGNATKEGAIAMAIKALTM